MSGPSTRSHRSSVRGMETTLTEVSSLLKANKSVVMITGAGLSAASGIPTFRGGSDSVWSVTAASLGRRSVFLKDPLRWYNEFFLRHFPMSFTRKTPNPGHEAIAALALAFPELRVVTQNIDGLHLNTVNAWPDPNRLIEAHGRLGLFKCVSGDTSGDEDEGEEGEGENECPYSYDKEIRPSAFPESVCATLEDDGCVAAARGLSRSLTEVPRCPHCGEAAPPMSLLFDEDYDSHSFYDFERVEEWFKGADALVFVGTSFAVTLTSLAIREAKRRKIPVFDFNLSVSLKASPALNAKTVLGRAEATLPTLAALAGATLTTSPPPAPAPAATGEAEADASKLEPEAAPATKSEAAAVEAEATAIDNPNHNHNAIHLHNNGRNRANGGGGGDGRNCGRIGCGRSSSSSSNGHCDRSSSNGYTNSSGCTSSDGNSSISGSGSGGDRSSSGSSSSGFGGGGSRNGSDSSSISGIISDKTPIGGNDDVENTKRASPAGRRAREDSAGGVAGKISELGTSRPTKKTKTLNGWVDGADVAGGPGTAAAAAVAAVEAAVEAAGVWGGGAPFLLEPALDTPLRKDQVRVELSEAYSRKPHPDREVEANVETLWQEQLAKNPLLFNGSKFRLAGFSTEGGRAHTPPPAAARASTHACTAMDLSEGGEGGDAATSNTSQSPPLPPPRSQSPTSPPTRKLHLRLGLTDYKTFRGTNWSPAAARLAADSARDHPWLDGAYLSQKLGVGAVVETSDGFVVSLRRSNGVAEGQGMMDAPGGHPEPEKIGLTAGALRGLSRKAKSSRRKVAQQATDELFDSAVQEVVDETNLPRSALGKPLLSGIVRQGSSFGAPSAAFIIPCSMGHAEVAALYAQGAKEAFESTELRLIPGKEIVAEGGEAWFAARRLQASPSFLGALELWRAHRFRSST